MITNIKANKWYVVYINQERIVVFLSVHVVIYVMSTEMVILIHSLSYSNPHSEIGYGSITILK